MPAVTLSKFLTFVMCVPFCVNWILGTVGEVEVSSRSYLLLEVAESLGYFHEVAVIRRNSSPAAQIWSEGMESSLCGYRIDAQSSLEDKVQLEAL